MITQEIGNAIVVNMGSMAETAGHMNVRMDKTENAMNAISLMINSEIKALNDRLKSQQSMVDSNRVRQAHRKYGILESKSVQSIKTLGGVPRVG